MTSFVVPGATGGALPEGSGATGRVCHGSRTGASLGEAVSERSGAERGWPRNCEGSPRIYYRFDFRDFLGFPCYSIRISLGFILGFLSGCGFGFGLILICLDFGFGFDLDLA